MTIEKEKDKRAVSFWDLAERANYTGDIWKRAGGTGPGGVSEKCGQEAMAEGEG